MKRVVITAALVWGAFGGARADDASGDPSLTDRAKGAVTSVADDARERADRMTKAAGEKAGEMAGQASAAAHAAAQKATDAASEKARDAVAYGKDMADRVASETKDQLHALGALMGRGVDKGKEWCAATLVATLDLTRSALLSAANALDETNAKARSDERLQRWMDVRSRFGFQGDRPSAAVSDELREHELRVARLVRTREVADAADDARSVKRSDRLLETEHARHHDKLEALSEEERRIREEEP